MNRPLYAFHKGKELAVANFGKVVTVSYRNTTWVKDYPHTYQAEDLCRALMKAETPEKIVSELPLYGFREALA